MKIQVQKEGISKALQTVQNAINPRATLPILSNILIQTEEKKIKLTGTDLDIGISVIIDADVQTPGAITVPAKRFSDIIREFSEGLIVITAKKNNIVTIESENTLFKIIGLPQEEFPKLPEFQENQFITLPQSMLKKMLNMTSFSMSRDETRYILNGTLFAIREDSISLVATDGRRLSLIKKPFETPKGLTARFIVPIKTVNELIRTLKDAQEDMKMLYTQNQILFDLGETTIISRLIEGEYPNYEQVIPKEADDKLVIDREKLLLATKRASLMTTQDSLAVRLDVYKEKVVVSKSTPDIGESKEELKAQYTGGQLSIGFNPNYIIDVLKNIDTETIAVELMGTDKPGVIRLGDEYTYVVLPMQLS